MSGEDQGVLYCTRCDFSTTNVFQIRCQCGGSLFLPIGENPTFHSINTEQNHE